jgi:hypothetical protein
MENPTDDPRQFAHDGAGFGDEIPPGMDTFLRVSWLQIINELFDALRSLASDFDGQRYEAAKYSEFNEVTYCTICNL